MKYPTNNTSLTNVTGVCICEYKGTSRPNNYFEFRSVENISEAVYPLMYTYITYTMYNIYIECTPTVLYHISIK